VSYARATRLLIDFAYHWLPRDAACVQRISNLVFAARNLMGRQAIKSAVVAGDEPMANGRAVKRKY
jgi:hypothetical protein